MQYTTAIIIDAKNPFKLLSIWNCGRKYAIPNNIPKFITRLNNPNVNKFIGNVSNLTIGFMKILIIVIIAAISIANQKLSTFKPGK